MLGTQHKVCKWIKLSPGMKHTKESAAAAAKAADIFNPGGVQITEYAPFSCAYAVAGLRDLDAQINEYNPKTGQVTSLNKTVYDSMVEWVQKHRKPILFTFMHSDEKNKFEYSRNKDSFDLTPENLKKAQAAGRYPCIKYLTETQTWHGTYMVGLYSIEIPE